MAGADVGLQDHVQRGRDVPGLLSLFASCYHAVSWLADLVTYPKRREIRMYPNVARAKRVQSVLDVKTEN